MAMIHQLGRKLRIQMQQFSGELSTGLGVVDSRFVSQALYGMAASGSVLLTEIARALDESIAIHDTHKRLSANLAHPSIAPTLSDTVLTMGAKRIRDDTLLIVDPSDITKKYAKKMEYLTDVRDASDKQIKKGYWLCSVVGCSVGDHDITPLAQEVWSSDAPDTVSENDTVLKLVERVLTATNHRGILVYDRGGDRRELLIPWTKDQGIRYLVRQRGDRHLLYRGSPRSAISLAQGCHCPYAEDIIKETDGVQRHYRITMGFVPVHLPEVPHRQVWLVVAKGFGKEPMMLLTTEPMRRNRKVLWWAVQAYLTRWRVEDTIRFVKQSYDLENVRVLTYGRLKTIVALLLATAYFTMVRLGQTPKLRVLMVHGLEAAKRIFGTPNFKYYALADGMRRILSRTKPLTKSDSNGLSPPWPQLPMF